MQQKKAPLSLKNENKVFLNDVFRRIRFALSLNDEATINIFALADYELSAEYLKNMMKKDTEDGFLPLRDKLMSLFLDGLIIKKRGKQTGPNARPISVLKHGERISNNDILRKIKIAMNYQEQDMLKNLQLAKFNVGKSELTALFRNKNHRNYKKCNNQLLRNFLQGMVLRHRPEANNK